MNAITEIKAAVEPLELLRQPFPAHQISKLPKETGTQAKQRKADQDAGKWPAKCGVCGGLHHPRAVHLDYVGHAAATDRLLDADLRWTWEPMAYTAEGLPAFDKNGGLWIKLTVDGVTRIGYGAADGKTGGDAIKEIIGDAIRNGGMRFGMALDLWHKGVLHLDAEDDAAAGDQIASAEEMAVNLLRGCTADKAMFAEAWAKNKDGWKAVMDGPAYARTVAEMKRLAATFPKDPPAKTAPPADEFGMGGDEIPDFE